MKSDNFHPYNEEESLHDCPNCSGTGMGTSDGRSCYWCHGSGIIDNRPDIDFDDDEEPIRGRIWR